MTNYDYTKWVAPKPPETPSHLCEIVKWLGDDFEIHPWDEINKYLPIKVNDYKDYQVKSEIVYIGETSTQDGIRIQFLPIFPDVPRELARKVIFRKIGGEEKLGGQRQDGSELNLTNKDIAKIPFGYTLKEWTMELSYWTEKEKTFRAGLITMKWEFKPDPSVEAVEDTVIWKWIPYER